MVFEKMSSLKSCFDPGPDGIPSHFLKLCSPILSLPVSFLFNLSLSSGYFPHRWRLAYIIPLHKSGDRTQVTNYRPISILSPLGKLLECFVSEYLFSSLKFMIIPEQHGFYPGRSTQSNLLVYHHYVNEAIEAGYQVDSIYTDFHKAFDRVDHVLLLEKLTNFGICGALLCWLRSYLLDRSQCVRIKGVLSRPISVTSGVPQGSHLGPLLFSFFINDIASEFGGGRFLLFADDLKLFKIIHDASDQQDLQADLHALDDWCCRNKMDLNIAKCSTITFSKSARPLDFSYTIRGVPLSRVDRVRDLGVTFHSSLSFNIHIENILSKANKMVGFIKRQCCSFTNVLPMLQLYYSLVRPVLEYCSVVWCPSYGIHIKRVENVQRRFVNYILFKLAIDRSDYSYQGRLRLLGMQSLEARRKNDSIKMGYKILSNQLDCNDLTGCLALRVPSLDTRCHDLFHVRFHRTNYGMHSPLTVMCRNLNSLPPECDLFHCTLAQLKSFLL